MCVCVCVFRFAECLCVIQVWDVCALGSNSREDDEPKKQMFGILSFPHRQPNVNGNDADPTKSADVEKLPVYEWQI